MRDMPEATRGPRSPGGPGQPVASTRSMMSAGWSGRSASRQIGEHRGKGLEESPAGALDNGFHREMVDGVPFHGCTVIIQAQHPHPAESTSTTAPPSRSYRKWTCHG
jgi:hypothetical protein